MKLDSRVCTSLTTSEDVKDPSLVVRPRLSLSRPGRKRRLGWRAVLQQDACSSWFTQVPPELRRLEEKTVNCARSIMNKKKCERCRVSQRRERTAAMGRLTRSSDLTALGKALSGPRNLCAAAGEGTQRYHVRHAPLHPFQHHRLPWGLFKSRKG